MSQVLTDPETVQALAVALVAVLSPVVIAVVRRWLPEFDVAPAGRKAIAAMLTAGVLAAAATPGTWWERLVAAVVAIVGSQGVYNVARNVRRYRSW